MNKIEKQLNEQIIYSGKIIKLHLDTVELPNGKFATREYVSHNGGAAILAIDSEENVYLVKQFRYPYREEILEIPAGKVEIGENPKNTAIRELSEETGFTVPDLTDYGVIYPSPGYTNEKLYIYFTRVEERHNMHLDADEFLDVVKMPIEEAFDKICMGVIKDGKTVYAICRYMAEKYRK